MMTEAGTSAQPCDAFSGVKNLIIRTIIAFTPATVVINQVPIKILPSNLSRSTKKALSPCKIKDIKLNLDLPANRTPRSIGIYKNKAILTE